MALQKCKECGNEISKSAAACPKCGAKVKKTGCLTKIVAGFLILMAIGVIANLGSKNKDNVSTTTGGNNQATTSGGNTQQTTASNTQIPADQQSFVKLVESYYDSYRQAPNELKKSALRAERKTAIQGALGKLTIQGWVGTLREMGTNSDGKAYITIQLQGSKIEIKTWNNALSDIADKSLIETGSDLYNKISNLSKGKTVHFSGAFRSGDKDYIREASLTESGAMTSPAFIMSFTDVSAE